MLTLDGGGPGGGAHLCRAKSRLASCALVGALAAPTAMAGQAQPTPPYSLEEIVRLASESASDAVDLAEQGCIEFPLDAPARLQLVDAGMSRAQVLRLEGVCFAGPVESVSLTPDRSVLEIGGEVRLEARALAIDGRALMDRPVEWSSSDADGVSVASDGTVRALRPGLFRVTARSENRTAEAEVRVLPMMVDVGSVFVVGAMVPGAGQFRVGRAARGVLTLASVAGVLSWGLLAIETTEFCASPVVSGGSCPPQDVLSENVSRPQLLPAIGVGAGLVLLSALDAALHAKSRNSEAERLRSEQSSDVEFTRGPEGSLQASFRVRVR